MSKSIGKFLIAAVLFSVLGSGAAFAQGKIATIDLRKVFDNYWKKKQGEAELKDLQNDIQKELKNMKDELDRGSDEYRTMLKGLDDNAISNDEKDKRKAAAERKLKDLQEQQANGVQYQKQAETRLMEKMDRMRNNILGEIRTIVNAKAKSGGYSMVMDTAAETINKTPVFLYTNNENDITDMVLQQLNISAPADLPKTDEKAAVDEKKKEGKK